MYICICIRICTYIYIYICRERERFAIVIICHSYNNGGKSVLRAVGVPHLQEDALLDVQNVLNVYILINIDNHVQNYIYIYIYTYDIISSPECPKCIYTYLTTII